MTEQHEIAAEPVDEHEFAIVEIMGHRKLVGAITEIERFGAKFMRVVPMFQGALMDVETLVAPGSIFCLTPISHEAAIRLCPKERYQLPDVVSCAALPPALPPPDEEDFELPWEDCDDD